MIGTATIDENGLAMGEIEDPEFRKKIFGDQEISLSVYAPEKLVSIKDILDITENVDPDDR